MKTNIHLRMRNVSDKTVEKIQVPSKSDKNNGTLHEDQYTFMIIRVYP